MNYPDVNWTCCNCQQVNAGWATECGRCDESRLLSPDPRKGFPSASGGQSFADCLGKFKAEKGMPELENEWADEGTDTHVDSAEEVPQTDTAERAREIEERVVGGLVDIAACKVHREKPGTNTNRIWGHDDDMNLVCSGQLDVFWITKDGNTAVISDLKSLYGKAPSAPENLQLRWQAALLWEHYGITQCFAFINQPLVTHNPVPVHYDEANLRRSHAEMIALAKRIMQPGLPRTAGTACKFCRAKISCPEYAAWTSQLKPVALRDLPLEAWTPAHWNTFLTLKSEARNWIDRMEDKAKSMLKADPASIQDWELKPGRVNRPIVKPYEVYARGKAIGILDSEFMEAVKITKGTWEKAVKRVTGLKGEKLDDKIKEMLDGCISEKQCEPTLVRKNL